MTGSRSSSFSRSGSDNESITKHIEVISINDTEQVSSEPIVPHERQVIGDIIQIWKEDPSSETLGVGKLHALVKDRHHNWSLSEKRVKTLLKKFGLSNNASSQFNYASEITSIHDGNLNLPDDVKIIMTNKRGKGLFAKTPLKQGDLIWQEPPYFFVPPLANLKLIKHGKACSYCGKLLPKSFGTLGGSRGLDCNGCSEMWCSTTCQRENQHLHCLLKHLRKGQKHIINSEHYLELEDYVIKEDWNALFAICLIYAEILEDKSGEKLAYFKSMARVSQKTRYKALDSSAGSFDSFSGGALFVEEQQERLWKEGFEKFAKVFPNAVSSGDIDYPEFLMMLGSYNINNLDSCIFKVHAHLNHSCSPTVLVKTPSTSDRNEGIKVYATKDLSANEELTTSYVNPNHTVQQRQRELRCNWGFTCNCTRCKDELKIQQRRQSNGGQPPRKQSHGNASRKQSNGSPIMDKHDIRKMLNDTKEQIGDEDIDLNIPLNYYGERRKSVRFDEKVIAVSE